ncbi:glucuronyl esterase domain-containing protein [Eisenbergiella porci]|uniref:glucuronyl esterase domain-containing protein n=1 Tax=Eisenbergiella porci TaxID=2652274 RepID=UPI002A800DA7|nr:alpha/beta hydrolase [Eisenbergiella porci]
MGKEAVEKELEKRGIPEVLRFLDGSEANTPELWRKRREEIREILLEECYGRLPVQGWEAGWEVVQEDQNAFGGKAVMRLVDVRIRANNRYASWPFRLVLPKNTEKPPVFLYLTFLPLFSDELTEELIDNGYALARVSYQDIASDQADGYSNGPGALFPGNAFDGWGKLAVWAWSMSRIMDCLTQMHEIDCGRIAVVGHSRLGKAALLCGALDERFSMVISNDSGAGGISLFRGKEGENVADLCRNFPYWFCGNLKKYEGGDMELPFDQHFLAALVAPRKLYAASAVDDEWADPRSEFLACAAVTPVYELLGEKGMVYDGFPEARDTLHEGSVGYHLRPGTHYLGRDDWQLFMEYRRRHGV